MRVIAGRARGMKLQVPKGATRPSTDRLREALFAILGAKVEEAVVLDLFAGSGALGLEALSRGAREAVMIDEHRGSAKVMEANLAKTRLEGGRVVCSEVFAYLKRRTAPADLVFADPPYAATARDDLAGRLLEDERLPAVLAADGLLVVEVESRRESPQGAPWRLLDRREYGRSAILLYVHAEEG